MAPKRKASSLAADNAESDVAKRAKPSALSPREGEREGQGGVYHFLACTTGGSNKFYEIRLCGTQVFSRYGRRGTAGATVVKAFASVEAAREQVDALLREKGGKGYCPAVPTAEERTRESTTVTEIETETAADNNTVIRTKNTSRTILRNNKNNNDYDNNEVVEEQEKKELREDDKQTSAVSSSSSPFSYTTVHYLECTQGGSYKFYEMRVVGESTVETRYGRIGSAGVTSRKSFSSAAEALRDVLQTLTVKLGSGYVDRTAQHASTSTAKQTTVSVNVKVEAAESKEEENEQEEDDIERAMRELEAMENVRERETKADIKATSSSSSSSSSSGDDAKQVFYLECTTGGSSKFYEVSLDRRTVFLRYGRIGADGVRSEKSFADEAKARDFADKTVQEKKKKGYKEVPALCASTTTHVVSCVKVELAESKESEPEEEITPSEVTYDDIERAVRELEAMEDVRESKAKAASSSSSSSSSSNDAKRVFYLECTTGGSSKFYEVSLDRRTVFLRYGRIGADGVRSEKSFADEAKARDFAEKTVLEKRKKGYREVDNSGSGTSGAALNAEETESGGGGDPLVDLEAGRVVFVQGSAAVPYKLKKFVGGYSCSCPGWIFQIKNKGVQCASCKHLKEIRGEEAEEQRCGVSSTAAAAIIVGKKNTSIVSKVSLAQQWKTSQNPTGYYMSEKLDGMRAYWTRGKLWTRNGNEIIAPNWFIAGLPEGEDLDGELFLGRQRFDDCMSIARRTDASEDWRQLRYVVFDCPSAAGGIGDRLRHAEQFLSSEKTPFAVLHPHTVCEGEEQLLDELSKVERIGGEGLMLRHPTAKHRGGRTSDLLKVKTFLDDEALVIDHEEGRGKYDGMVGSLICVNKKGARFKVGSGLTDSMRSRSTAPKKGTVITFKYFELTKDGIPRFPTFMRVRPDVDASVFPV